MTTRRRFLESSVLGVAGSALLPDLSLADTPATTQNAEAAPGAATETRDFWNDWPAYIKREMNAARTRRLAKLAQVRTAEQATARAQEVRESLWKILGGRPEKTPLNARVTHMRDRGYCRIETTIFESVPGVYVTANLYLPAAGRSPFPAILAPVGHSDNGKAYASYQYFFQNMARQGFVVLTYDPWGQGERLQYIDPATGKSRLWSTAEHSEAGRPMVLMGQGVARYMAWDGVRGLDYLLSRPEVDKERIGCTGHSGGGTMTTYLVAMDERMQAAVDVQGNTENLAGPVFEPPGAIDDAEQNIVNSLAMGFDRADLLCAFAPKPLLVCYTTHDVGETYSPVLEQSTAEIYSELRQTYAAFGKRENVALFTGRLPHGLGYFERSEAYRWFHKWLKDGATPPEEVGLDVFPETELNATETGQVLTTPGCRSAVQLNIDNMKATLPASPVANATDVAQAREQIRAELRELLALPAAKPPLAAETISKHVLRNVQIEEIQFRTEPEIRIPAWFAAPSQMERATHPAVLYLTDRGGDDLFDDPGALDKVLAAGHAVFAPTLRGLGISAPRFPATGPNYWSDGDRRDEGLDWDSLALGIPAVGQRVTDILRSVDYVAGRVDVDATQIRILARGDTGIAALLAAALDLRVRALLLDRTLLSYASIVEAFDYSTQIGWFVPGILKHFDLPDAAAAIGPRACWLVNPAGPKGAALEEESAREALRARIGVGAAATGHLRVKAVSGEDHQETYLDWIRNS